MTTIEVMLEALRKAVLQNGCDMLMTGEELRKCEKAIAAGEDELAREPVAWIARVHHPWGNGLGQIRQLSYENSTDDAMPLYTREGVK